MALIRKLWRLIDRRLDRALAPDFDAHDRHSHRPSNSPTPHPAGHFGLPPPRG
jgi:hypothetical protein